MRPLTTIELLDVWEQSRNQTLLNKSLYLLAVACSMSMETVRKLSIGERDVRLFQMREWLFGSFLKNVTVCPSCHQPVEWESRVSDFRLQNIHPEPSVAVYELQKDGYHICFRLPDSNDIEKALQCTDLNLASQKVLHSCLLKVQLNNENLDIDTLPDALLETVSQRMSDEDPQADITISLRCPECSYGWEDRFNILSYLWTEINGWALRILHEVYLLAKNFHWCEREILQMSAYRRQLYLEMIR